MKQEIKEYFKTKDPQLYPYILKLGDHVLSTADPDTYFYKLCREIAFQQLSGKAGSTIFGRVEELFPNKTLLPNLVSEIEHELLRKAGLSNSKASYIKNIANAVLDGHLVFENFTTMEDEEVINALTQVKGIGRWTAEMFLIFTLGRENVFSFGDLGLKKGLMKVYDYKKEPKRTTIERIVRRWEPYKSYGSLALWEAIDS